jgi:hypothetical protein
MPVGSLFLAPVLYVAIGSSESDNDFGDRGAAGDIGRSGCEGMNEYPLPRIFTWEFITLALAVSCGMGAMQVPHAGGLWGFLQLTLMVLTGVSAIAWFFLSFGAFPTVVRELAYAHRHSRRIRDILCGWGGILSGLSAVGALAWGIMWCAF